MVNMKKHSGADNVVIKFGSAGNEAWINYFDNGVGLPQNHILKNGLKNTGNRIKEISGAITFDSHPGKGLDIYITFPVN
jgi:signal transduction histidine kinase